jgi:hypothetical protein
VSSPRRHRPPLQVRERSACMCAQGHDCSSFAPGHALHLIHTRLVAATPSEWADAIVESVDAAAGETVLRTLDGRRVVLWSARAPHADAGEPVALHERYRVLARGGRRFNVAVLETATPESAS